MKAARKDGGVAFMASPEPASTRQKSSYFLDLRQSGEIGGARDRGRRRAWSRGCWTEEPLFENQIWFARLVSGRLEAWTETRWRGSSAQKFAGAGDWESYGQDLPVELVDGNHLILKKFLICVDGGAMCV